MMKILDCRGAGLQRGRAHGEEARDLIRRALDRWSENTRSSLPRPISIDTYAYNFLNGTKLIATVDALTPDLADEIRGIAEGSGASFDLIAAYNLMDEQWWYDLTRPAEEPGCSTFATKLENGVLLAQNMDLPTFMDGSQVVLRLDDGVTERLVLSSAGLIGLTGVSRAGFAVCVNTLLMLHHDQAGLPVSFALRHALDAVNGQEAVRRLRSVPHASGQHYAVADRHGATSLECSKAGAYDVPFRNSMTHTNHPLQSSDLATSVNDLLENRGRIAFSRTRLAVLDGAIEHLKDVQDAIDLLSNPDLPICVTPTASSASQTFGSVAFHLGERPQAHFCLGGPGECAWSQIAFSR